MGASDTLLPGCEVAFMNRKFAGAFAALIVLAVPRIACAAGFFLIDVDMETDKDDPTATVLDPASIAVESDGSRTFRFAMVHDADSGEISEYTMEADCSSLRWRQTHSTYTSGLGDVSENSTPEDWETLEDGTNGAYMHKTVCDYPNNQPTGDQVFQADDYQTMLQKVAQILSTMEK
jgi:hypothetical protein